MIRASLLALAVFAAASAPALVQARPMAPRVQAHFEAPTWSQLSPKQRADLAALEQRWDRIPPSKRAQILQRWQRWQGLPPSQQQAMREGRRNFRELSPRQRERMRDSFHALRALPPAEQQRLRALWRDMSPEQRREWLRRGGPGLAPPPR